MKWQPMDSAPHDITQVLLKYPDGIFSVGYWDDYYAEGGRGFDGHPTAWISSVGGEELHLYYDDPIGWIDLNKLKE